MNYEQLLNALHNIAEFARQVGAKKEEAKSMTEEGITGAFIRDLKSNTRTVCFASGSGEHQIDDSNRGGLSHFKELLAKDNYESKSVDLLTKAEVPSECTTLVVAGPTKNYEQPEVDAIKKYVEDGGRAFFQGTGFVTFDAYFERLTKTLNSEGGSAY